MRILAFDTSTAACSVALLNNQEVHVIHEVVPMQHAQRILQMIKTVLEKQSLALSQLDAIAYGCGPGSFTGIRIASSVAQGLAYGTGCPIIRISSLAAMAGAAYLEKKGDHFLVCVDARMEQVYFAAYKWENANLCLEGEEKLIRPEEIAYSVSESTWVGLGDGWASYPMQLAHLHRSNTILYPNQLPNAEAVLMLAKPAFTRQQFTPFYNAIPVYLR